MRLKIGKTRPQESRRPQPDQEVRQNKRREKTVEVCNASTFKMSAQNTLSRRVLPADWYVEPRRRDYFKKKTRGVDFLKWANTQERRSLKNILANYPFYMQIKIENSELTGMSVEWSCRKISQGVGLEGRMVSTEQNWTKGEMVYTYAQRGEFYRRIRSSHCRCRVTRGSWWGELGVK